MSDLSQIVGFDWDDGNSLKSADKHSASQAEAEQVFTDERLLIAADVRHSQGEERHNAMGRTIDGRLLHVTFTLRDGRTKIRVISARDANRKERRIYEQEA
jgi:uncharacterized DUF497 family protein